MTTAAMCATRAGSWNPSLYGSASYGLDPVGNRTSVNSSFTGFNPISGTYNADDQISSESYDANGNVTGAGGYQMTYDAENHLLTKVGNGVAISMVYDAFGNRVSKTVTTASGSVTTKYLVEDDVNPTGLPQVVEELVNGAVTRQYTYGLQRISQNLSPAVTGAATWTPSFYVYDGGGSVRQLTNSTSVVTDEYLYDAFGNSFTKTGTTPNNYLYRGEQYDSDLGLYYLRARYYNPNTGRFLSRDPKDSQAIDATGAPVDPQSLHKYLYAGDDPVNRIDPLGREEMFETALIEGGSKLAVEDYVLWRVKVALYNIPRSFVLERSRWRGCSCRMRHRFPVTSCIVSALASMCSDAAARSFMKHAE
jgi:RHS repeat-associated protein